MMGDIESHIIEKGITIWKDRISHKNFIKEMDINGEKFMIISVRSILKNYGLIGITIKPNEKKINQQYIEQLNFISELSAMILDRFYLEQMSDSLIIAEEQNRIANEIHDSVSQRLFSISCAIHEVMKKSKKISIEQLQEKLMCIQDAANISIKELRRTIYGLSYRKSGEGIFQLDIEKLLKDVAKLNNVDINFKMSGNEEHLSSPLKKALYRIVSEATGNAIRHGKCSRLDIHLNIDNTMTNLFIKDDGEGFILQNVYQQKDTGLGITNMKHLVESFNGRILIDSTLKKGTTIEITIPNNKVNKIQEGGMAI
jgi:signal transduction histidine kinase